MAILQHHVKIDSDLLQRIKKLKAEVAQIAAVQISDEFTELLRNAPQASGNYTANMAIKAGKGAGNKGGQLYFPKTKETRTRFSRGSMPAIMAATRENKNTIANIKAHIISSAGLWPGVTIYNRLAYAEIVEGYDAGELRAVNAEGAHAMAVAKVRMAESISRPILEGTPEWKELAARGKAL